MIRSILYPEKESWESLCLRPVANTQDLSQSVSDILQNVKTFGDKALYNYAEKFDKVAGGTFKVSADELTDSAKKVSPELMSAISIAKSNIEKFHSAQLSQEEVIETSAGVRCWRKSVGIEKVGLYIPGGTAPLFSTLLMLGIPAIIAGCKEIVVCSPPNKDNEIHPAILYTASLLGISSIFKTGGAQAIAAMAYGTESVPKVYKIFGPGNQYVTRAKELIQQQGIAIDLPAGPSEVLIIADQTANPVYVAADLLSQAEHGIDSQVILLSNDQNLIQKTGDELKKQLSELPRQLIASKALENSFAILLKNIDECMLFSNAYAPEHLIINTLNANLLAEKVMNAGSVFIGPYSCESAGDYASGTNHTLPTNGFAKSYSGVSVDSFIKKISFQELSAEGIKTLGPVIELMAEAEQLIGHKNAVSVRLKNLNND